MRKRNIIDAICTLVKVNNFSLIKQVNGNNRANSKGEALEEFVKDVFADTIDVRDINNKKELLSETFSYLGNNSNPPDSMLRYQGDAIEVKKIESITSQLQLNSSYPKSKLFSDSNMISEHCRTCEKWDERDMIYVVGFVKNDVIDTLCFVYGEDYCAEMATYERIKNIIKEGVEAIPNIEFSETNELGRINRIDPLGITNLRIRGMWLIDNPINVFSYIYQRESGKSFNFMAIINEDKLKSLDNYDKLKDLSREMNNLCITDVKITNPNNPASLRNAKLVKFFN